MTVLPEQFKKRLQKMLGDEFEDFLSAYDNGQYHSLRINTLKADTEDFLRKAPWKKQLSSVAWNPNAFYYEESIRPGKHPYHEAGVYYIQEASAMLPAIILDAKPGEKVLDLCAAPGGKSTQLAGALRGRGLLVSNEIHPARAQILSENIERLGIRNAIVTNEAPADLASHFPLFFDRICVDAPCSGEGMFRKNEEALPNWSLENIRICADRQDEILESADRMLRPGGRLVYSTCTFAPEENEGTIDRFLKAHPTYQLIEPPYFKGVSDGEPDFAESDNESLRYTRRLWPHKLKGEGHFVALLQKGEISNLQKNTLEDDSVHSSDTSYEERNTSSWDELFAPLLANGKGGQNKDKRKNKNSNLSRNREDNYQARSDKYFSKGKVSGKYETTTGNDAASQLAALTLAKEFLNENLLFPLSGKLHLFGKQLYLLPSEMPSLTGLKVLRPGLHLGTLVKDRFEPSHALALALSKDTYKYCHNLSSTNEEDLKLAYAYQNGETFPAEGDKGWYLITLDGYSLGFGKLAGGIMKNHYPKGLRGKTR